MMGFVYEALEDADIFILVVEAGQKHFDDIILGRINAIKQPVLVLINKFDKVKKKDIEAHITYWKENTKGQLLPVAALHKFNVDVVMSRILQRAPRRICRYYPKDELTNRNMRFFISEIIREKALVLYQKEIPYSIEVLIDEYKEEEAIIRIKAFIFVARESQRRIVIGHEGKAIKRLGTEARKAIERFVDKHIYIDLL
ncbi:MAG: GTPase Era [Bacteroidales bacterium]|nr:GTPase Era [Bacteroidales bacterium]